MTTMTELNLFKAFAFAICSISGCASPINVTLCCAARRATAQVSVCQAPDWRRNGPQQHPPGPPGVIPPACTTPLCINLSTVRASVRASALDNCTQPASQPRSALSTHIPYNTIQYNTKFVKRHVAVASEASKQQCVRSRAFLTKSIILYAKLWDVFRNMTIQYKHECNTLH